MCDQSNNKPDDLLDRAVASLRDSASSADPPPALIATTISRLATANHTPLSNWLTWRSIIMKPQFRLAAAAIIAVAVFAAAWFFAFHTEVTFADVIANVANIKSVSYKISGTLDLPGRPSQKIGGEVFVKAPSHVRMVMEPGGIQIYDWHAGKAMALDPVSRTAMTMEMSNLPKEQAESNFLEQFKTYDSKFFDQIGEKKIGERAAIGFKSKPNSPILQRTIWVDKQTQLPIEIESTMSGLYPGMTTIENDFKWDVPLEDSLFSLTPPEGYTVRNMAVDTSTPTEKDVLEALRFLAQVNGDSFPDNFSMTALTEITQKMAQQMPDKNSPEWQAAREKMMERVKPLQDPSFMVKLTRGIGFTARPDLGTDWHYAGKGVKMGQTGTPILWYHPTNSPTWRVIDADLSVHDAAPDQLPKVESVPLAPTAATRPSP